MKRIHFNANTLASTLTDCEDYAASAGNTREERNAYIKEINGVRCQHHTQDAWHRLANTGIFHDAIGKPVNITDDYVEYETEY